MKFVAASQRVDVLPDRGEIRDSLDQSWTLFCDSMGLALVPIPNHLSQVDAFLDQLKPSAILLTGGNAVSGDLEIGQFFPERDKTERRLLLWARAHRAPVLAVCRGFQFVNLHFGGGVRAMPGHVRTRHSISWDGHFCKDKNFPSEVNSYHSVGIHSQDLTHCLRPLATSADGFVEAAMHRTLPIFGIMWHPERSPMAKGWFLEFLKSHLLGNR